MQQKQEEFENVKPLSWSEMQLFQSDRAAWFRRYIQGIKDPPTFAMKRGTDIHEYCFFGMKNARAIDETVYMESDIAIHEKIRQGFQRCLENYADTERFLFEEKKCITLGGIPTIGIWDGVQEDLNIIIELKTGGSWTKPRAESHGQVWMYAAQYQSMYKQKPLVLLISANTKNAAIRSFIVTPDESKIQGIIEAIQETWDEMGEYKQKRV